jgi:hypothetical protein
MVNEQWPTSRIQHIATQYFAIQEWCDAGNISLVHIPGVLNAADQQTKSLASHPHYQHAHHLMGHFGPPIHTASSVESAPSISSSPLPGEGVDAPPSVSPIDFCLSVVQSCVSSSIESSESPFLGSAFLQDPCPLLCPSCQIGTGCLCSSSSRHPNGPALETLAPTNHHDPSHNFHPIGLSPSPTDGSHLASS